MKSTTFVCFSVGAGRYRELGKHFMCFVQTCHLLPTPKKKKEKKKKEKEKKRKEKKSVCVCVYIYNIHFIKRKQS